MGERTKYLREYHDMNYTRIILDVRPEVKEKLKQKAAKAGKSLTAYLVDAGLGCDTNRATKPRKGHK